MPIVEYSPQLTLREARDQYFEDNGLRDGGYDDRWVILRAGGVPFAAFPNSPQRIRSVRLHDLHHVLTGYDTSWLGEGEISAWELASGCEDHWAAWVLNSFAGLIGLFLSPRAIARAWKRGRCSKNFYSGEYEEALLDRHVGEMRMALQLGLDS